MKILYLSNSIIPSVNANSIHALKMCDKISDYYKELTLICLSENKDINIDQINKNIILKIILKL